MQLLDLPVGPCMSQPPFLVSLLAPLGQADALSIDANDADDGWGSDGEGQVYFRYTSRPSSGFRTQNPARPAPRPASAPLPALRRQPSVRPPGDARPDAGYKPGSKPVVWEPEPQPVQPRRPAATRRSSELTSGGGCAAPPAARRRGGAAPVALPVPPAPLPPANGISGRKLQLSIATLLLREKESLAEEVVLLRRTMRPLELRCAQLSADNSRLSADALRAERACASAERQARLFFWGWLHPCSNSPFRRGGVGLWRRRHDRGFCANPFVPTLGGAPCAAAAAGCIRCRRGARCASPFPCRSQLRRAHRHTTDFPPPSPVTHLPPPTSAQAR